MKTNRPHTSPSMRRTLFAAALAVIGRYHAAPSPLTSQLVLNPFGGSRPRAMLASAFVVGTFLISPTPATAQPAELEFVSPEPSGTPMRHGGYDT